MNKTRQAILYFLSGLAFLGVGVFVANQQINSVPDLKSAQLLPTGKKIFDMNLELINSAQIDSKFFLGHWTLVFFGFTSCPDLCPTELQKLSRLLSLVGEKSELQILFVSVDPERDAADKLKSYLGFFNPRMIGATGNNKEIARLARLFGAAYDRSLIQDNKLQEITAGMDMPFNAGENYQVNHSLRIFIVNNRGEYVGSFAPPHDTEVILKDMQELM